MKTAHRKASSKHPRLVRTLSAIHKLGQTDNETLARFLGADVQCTRVTTKRYQAAGLVDVVNPGHMPIVFRLSQESVVLLSDTVPAAVKPMSIVESAKRQPNSVFQLGSL